MIAPVEGSGSCPAWIHIVGKRARSGSFTGAMLSFDSIDMARPRLPDGGARARRPAAPLALTSGTTDRPVPARDLLLHSLGRPAVHIRRSLKVVIGLIRQFVALPTFVSLLNSGATLAMAVSLGFFVWRLFLADEAAPPLAASPAADPLLHLHRGRSGAAHHCLLRARRVDRHDEPERVSVQRRLRRHRGRCAAIAQAAAAEIGREPAGTAITVGRVHRNAGPALSRSGARLCPADGRRSGARPRRSLGTRAGAEQSAGMAGGTSRGWQGTIAVARPDAPNETELVVRAAVPAIVKDRRIGYVIADVPVDAQVLDLLHDRTGVQAPASCGAAARSDTASVVDSINRSPGGASGSVVLQPQRHVLRLQRLERWFDPPRHRGHDVTPPRSLDRDSRGLSRCKLAPLTFGDAIMLMLVFVAISS